MPALSSPHPEGRAHGKKSAALCRDCEIGRGSLTCAARYRSGEYDILGSDGREVVAVGVFVVRVVGILGGC